MEDSIVNATKYDEVVNFTHKLEAYSKNHNNISFLFDKRINKYEDDYEKLLAYLSSDLFIEYCNEFLADQKIKLVPETPSEFIASYKERVEDRDKYLVQIPDTRTRQEKIKTRIKFSIYLAVAVTTYRIMQAAEKDIIEKRFKDSGDSEKDFRKYDEFMTKNFRDPDKTWLFRGQSDYTWDLSPTMLRNLENDKWENALYVNTTTVENIYKASELTSRAKTLHLSDGKLDYSFFALMQHACSYSLLIDFTEDRKVAESFLCSRQNLNTFLFKPGNLFVLEKPSDDKKADEEDIANTLRDDPIVLLFKPIELGKEITAQIYNAPSGSADTIKIKFDTLENVIKCLCPEFKIFGQKTNDRMKVQSGYFIFFYGYLTYKGNVFFQLNDQIKLWKIEIGPKLKQKIYEKNVGCMNVDRYEINSLMNPYYLLNK